MKSLKEIQEHRHTIKLYDANKHVSDSDWEQIIDFMHHAPHSMNLQQTRLVVVNRETSLGAKLADKSVMMNNAKLMESMSKTVFFITPKEGRGADIKDPAVRDGIAWGVISRKKPATEATDEEIDKTGKMILDFFRNMGFKDYGNWATRQAYIQLAYMEMAAASLGLDTTPMEGYFPDKVKELLIADGLMTEDEQVTVAQAIGYRLDDTTYNNSPRKPLSWFVTEVK